MQNVTFITSEQADATPFLNFFGRPGQSQERVSSSVALDSLGSASSHENRGARMKHWQAIAEKLSKAGFSWGCVSALDSNGRTIWIADAHRDDGKRFVVHADEKLIAFL
jgi:hypothetical protein